MPDINPLDMSDEDFLNLSAPPVVEAPQSETTGAEVVVEAPVVEQQNEPEAPQPVIEAPAQEGADSGVNPGTEGAEGDLVVPPVQEQQEQKEPEGQKPEGLVPPTDPKVEGADKEKQAPTINYEENYKALLAPIKANGKELEIRSPEELRQLAQMGANYTQKMQAIAPHRKMLTMVQNNSIDEDKLSFLIDLDKGNPEAIQKFLKDKSIDPLSIDLESESNYREGTHKVDDKEVAFRTVLDEALSNPVGQQVLQTIDSTWDDASKAKLWEEPELLTALQTQKENGIYDRINAEMDRMKTLGTIPAETPYLTAYRIVGDKIAESGGFDDLIQKTVTPAPKPAPTPIEVRQAPPKVEVDNGDKVRAAAPSASTAKTAKTSFNPLELSDEEFLAQMNSFKGRV